MRPRWTFAGSFYFPRFHCLVYRDDTLGVQLQIMTRRKRSVFQRPRRSLYFIDGVDKAFQGEEEMMRDLSQGTIVRERRVPHL